eukprot:TRINITY_DN1887_c0_g1_i1.p1 TRINITY_DN1887_c0_g1~~TRINITY_DN1887_c0_g1_i1.p1  ORF type:complete len:218 (+),score=57.04 TRINITY_DN1887_c0_g1_i1:195-848(+)
MGFFLIATLPSHSVESRDKVLKGLEKMTEFVKANEPLTKQYYFYTSNSGDDFKVYGFEEYDFEVTKLDELHGDSAAFKSFIGDVEKHKLFDSELLLNFYVKVAGFVNRTGRKVEPSGYIWVARLFTKEGQSDFVAEKLSALAAEVERTEPKTLTYVVLKNMNNPNEILVFERYTDEAALTHDHHNNPAFVATGKAIADSLEKRITTSYYESGVGFLQ